jgi:hypothetical protein
MSRFTSIEDVNICVEALKKVLKIQRNYWFNFLLI